MHWNILQLDPATATLQDVKRAYARLLKSCRPDQNPEGFRKLQDAYEKALAQLGRGSQSVQSPLVFEETPDFEHEEKVSLPLENDELWSAATSFEKALATADPTEIEAATRELERLANEPKRDMGQWSQWVGPVISHGAPDAEIAFSKETLLRELSAGHSEVTLALVARWDRQGRPKPAAALGKFLLEHREALNPDSAQAIILLACMLARWMGRDAEALADLAFPMLPPALKKQATGKLAVDLHLGRALLNLPLEWRAFWLPVLTNPEEAHDWTSERSKAAIRALVSPAAVRWPGRMDLHRALPIEVSMRLPSPAVPTPHAPIKPSYTIDQLGRGPLIFIGVIVLFNVLRACGHS